VRDDDTTEVAPRQSPSTTTSVRLFNGLGGVELGVRHTGQKAMLFVRFRKLVIAGWWKAPGVPGKSPLDLAVERADERRAAAGVTPARPEVQSKDDSGIASVTTSASVSHSAGIAEIGGPAGSAREPGPARPGLLSRLAESVPSGRSARPEEPAVPSGSVQSPAAEPEVPGRKRPASGPKTPAPEPNAQVIEPEAPALAAEEQNVMHRLWRRVSASFKKER